MAIDIIDVEEHEKSKAVDASYLRKGSGDTFVDSDDGLFSRTAVELKLEVRIALKRFNLERCADDLIWVSSSCVASSHTLIEAEKLRPNLFAAQRTLMVIENLREHGSGLVFLFNAFVNVVQVVNR